MTTKRRMLVILAHPDDESFPIGGTLAKYTQQGVEITLICATRGERGIEGLLPEAAGDLRERELREAGKILGLSRIIFLGYTDGGLAREDEVEAVGRLRKIIQEIIPQVVLTFGPDGISGHPDHVTVSRWTELALDSLALNVRLFYIAPSADTFQACGVSGQGAGQDQTPQVWIDIGDQIAVKTEAIQRHASQKGFENSASEGRSLACHESFNLARPVLALPETLDDLFAPLPVHEEVRASKPAPKQRFSKRISVRVKNKI